MKILDTIYNIPSTVVTFVSNVIFGNNEADVEGKPEFVQSLIRGGILGSIANGFYYAFQAVSHAARTHRDAINIAVWASLAVAAAVAITGAVLAAFYPAILATIVGFSVYGISLASLAGASVVAQVAVASGFAAAATQIVSYTAATLVNGCKALLDLCFGGSSKANSNSSNEATLSSDVVEFKQGMGMSALHTARQERTAALAAEPAKTVSLFEKARNETNTAEYTPTASASI